MTSLNISLPEPLKRYVEERVAEGEYGTPSEYVRDLIRHDRDHARAELERKLLDAMDSQNYIELSEEEVYAGSLVELLRTKLAQKSSR